VRNLRMKKTRRTPIKISAGKIAALALCLAAAAGMSGAGLGYANAWRTFSADAGSASAVAVPGDPVASLVQTSVNPIDMSADQADQLMSLLNGGGDYASAQDYLMSAAVSSADAGSGAAPGSAFLLNYRFAYDVCDENYSDVYARFGLSGDVENMILIDGKEVFCVQNLSYTDGGLAGMARMNACGDGLYAYYPEPVRPGDEIDIQYLLYFPDGYYGEIPADGLMNFELARAVNNNSVVDWNVVVSGGHVSPYDEELVSAPEFMVYSGPDGVVSFGTGASAAPGGAGADTDKNGGSGESPAAGEEQNVNAGEDQNQNAGEDQNLNAGEDQNLNAGEDQNLNAGEDQNQNSSGNQSQNSSGNQNQNAGADQNQNSSGNQNQNSSGNQNQNSSGNQNQNAGVDQNLNHGENQNINAGVDQNLNAGEDLNLNAGGDASLGDGEDQNLNDGGAGISSGAAVTLSLPIMNGDASDGNGLDS